MKNTIINILLMVFAIATFMILEYIDRGYFGVGAEIILIPMMIAVYITLKGDRNG